MHSATASVSFVTHLEFRPQCRTAFDSYMREAEGDAYCAGFVDHAKKNYSWSRFGEDLLRGALARQWGYITRKKLPKGQIDLFGLQLTYTLRKDIVEDGKKKGVYVKKHWRTATLGDIRRHIDIASEAITKDALSIQNHKDFIAEAEAAGAQEDWTIPQILEAIRGHQN
jgi:hypothetical protein